MAHFRDHKTKSRIIGLIIQPLLMKMRKRARARERDGYLVRRKSGEEKVIKIIRQNREKIPHLIIILNN